MVVTPQVEAFSRQMHKKMNFQFDILSDQKNLVASKFGLNFNLPEDLQDVYQKLGVNLPRFNGDDSWTLPIPARYVIDRLSVIRYFAADPDYTIRPEPQETIDALRGLESASKT